MTGTVIDMHMHTTLGAYDSALKPADLASSALAVGLTGVTITEHDRLWDSHMLARFRDDHSALFVCNGIEVSTDSGHIIAIGLPAYVPGIHRLAKLREVADEAGAFLIGAHPFRHWLDRRHFERIGQEQPDMTPEALARRPVFQLVDAIEVLNGCNTEAENQIAFEVAERLGKPGTGGSDCHSRQGIGYYCTLFERELEAPAMMVAELHAGRFLPASGLAEGALEVYRGAEPVPWK